MSERITKRHVEKALERYVQALKLAGLDRTFDSIELRHGSKTYDNSFCLTRVQDGESYGAPGTFDGFLGWTKREAYNNLLTMARSFESVGIWSELKEN